VTRLLVALLVLAMSQAASATPPPSCLNGQVLLDGSTCVTMTEVPSLTAGATVALKVVSISPFAGGPNVAHNRWIHVTDNPDIVAASDAYLFSRDLFVAKVSPAYGAIREAFGFESVVQPGRFLVVPPTGQLVTDTIGSAFKFNNQTGLGLFAPLLIRAESGNFAFTYWLPCQVPVQGNAGELVFVPSGTRAGPVRDVCSANLAIRIYQLVR
jgi:hypothetical protein